MLNTGNFTRLVLAAIGVDTAEDRIIVRLQPKSFFSYTYKHMPYSVCFRRIETVR